MLRNQEISYPYVDVFQIKSSITEDDNAPPTLLFFVFDSNLKKDPKPTLKERSGATARGEITTEDLEDFNKLVEEASKGKVKDKDGKEYNFKASNTIRIALLHHHPIPIPCPPRQKAGIVSSFKGIFNEEIKWTTELAGSQGFLKACYESGIQLVLFGHDHHQHYEERADCSAKNHAACKNAFGEYYKPLHLFCCPSTLEINATPNGFYTFDIHNKKRITWQLYSKKFSGKEDLEPFQPVPQKQGEITL